MRSPSKKVGKGPRVVKGHGQKAKKLGRGQSVQVPLGSCSVSNTALTATLTFDRPVVIRAIPDLHVHTVRPTNFQQLSPTSCVISYSGVISGQTWQIFPDQQWCVTAQGGLILPSSGTFS